MAWYKTAKTVLSSDDPYMRAVKGGDFATAREMVDSLAKSLGMRLWHHGTQETVYQSPPGRKGDEQALERLREIQRKVIEDGTFDGPVKEILDLPVVLERVGHPLAGPARSEMAKAKGEAPAGEWQIGFNEFIPGEFGIHLGTEDAASTKGSVFGFYVRMKNPLRLDDLGTWNYQSVLREARKAGVAITESDYDKVFNSPDEDLAARELLKSKGYDGVIYKNEVEGFDDSIMVFDSSQIKLASAVTKDDNGNVIPLSKRFDSSTNDIRY